VWFDGCDDKVPNISAFLKEFREPEASIIEKLWKDGAKAAKDLEKSVKNMKPSDIDLDVDLQGIKNGLGGMAASMELALALYDRLGEKAQKLIDEYKYKPEKFYSVATAASVFNIFWGASKVNKDDIDKWWRETWNFHMAKLVEGHDYSKAYTLEIITLIGAYAGVKVPKDYTDKLGNALTFDVEWETAIRVWDEWHVFAEGHATVSMDKWDETVGYFGEATGESDVTAFSSPSGNFSVVDMPSSSFTAKLLRLDPCNSKTVTIGLDDLGDLMFTYKSTINPSMVYTVQACPIYVLGDAIDYELDLWAVKMPITNFSEQCEKHFELDNGAGKDEIDFTLTHKPKSDVYFK